MAQPLISKITSRARTGGMMIRSLPLRLRSLRHPLVALALVVVKAAHLKLLRGLVGHANESELVVATFTDRKLSSPRISELHVRGASERQPERT